MQEQLLNLASYEWMNMLMSAAEMLFTVPQQGNLGGDREKISGKLNNMMNTKRFHLQEIMLVKKLTYSYREKKQTKNTINTTAKKANPS